MPMKALVLKGPERLEIENVAIPKPADGQVLIRVKYCGICGSDLHAYHVGKPEGLILGHEFTGEIVDIGPGVTGWNPGQRVAVIPGVLCGTCYSCRQGLYNLCERSMYGGLGLTAPGAMAEYICVKSDMLRELPENVDFLNGALAEPLAVSLHAIYQGNLQVGEKVLITGAGPIGMLCLKLALIGGASEIWVIESNPRRREMAHKAGASYVLPPERDSLRMIRRCAEPGINLALECAGVPDALNMALKSVRPRGRVVVAGIHQIPVEVEFNRIAVKEIQIRGSFGFIGEMESALNLISKNTGDFETIITDVVSLEEAPAAFHDLFKSRRGLKTVIKVN